MPDESRGRRDAEMPNSKDDLLIVFLEVKEGVLKNLCQMVRHKYYIVWMLQEMS
jgi:hypothetical protein